MKKKILFLSGTFLLLAVAVCFGFTTTLDTFLYQYFTTDSHPVLHSLGYFFSFFASFQGLISVTILMLFFLSNNKMRLYLVIDLLISGLFIIISKNIFTIERPLIGQLLLDSYSFPSGHAFAATTFYGFLIYLLSKSTQKPNDKKNIILCLTIFIALIAFSRIIIGVHYLSDIIGGLLLGSLCLYLLIYLYEKDLSPSQKEAPFHKSLSYAFTGIKETIRRERNMVIHLIIMLLVIVAGCYFEIQIKEWISCFIVFGAVISLELVNTALENVVDLVTKEKKEQAKRAKDAAAGAVLVMAFFSVIVGLFIFLPKIFS